MAPKKRNPPSKAAGFMRKKRKTTVNARLKKVENLLNSESLERHLHETIDWTTGVTVHSASPLLLYSFESSEGTQWYQRLGREVFLQSLIANIDIRCGRTKANYRPYHFRVIVGFQRYDAYAGMTASSICDDLFNTTTPDPFAMYTLRIQTGMIGSKYIILRDKMFLGPGTQQNMYRDNDTIAYTCPWRKLLKMKVSMKNNITRWDRSSALPPEENRPFILIISDNDATDGHSSSNPIDIFYHVRTFFTEKKVN